MVLAAVNHESLPSLQLAVILLSYWVPQGHTVRRQRQAARRRLLITDRRLPQLTAAELAPVVPLAQAVVEDQAELDTTAEVGTLPPAAIKAAVAVARVDRRPLATTHRERQRHIRLARQSLAEVLAAAATRAGRVARKTGSLRAAARAD